MKQLLGILTVLSLFCMQNSFAEVYTCTKNGHTVYQGKPCAGTQKNKLNIPQTNLTDAQKYKLWKASREPLVGMSGQQVISSTSWGAPDRKRSYTTSRGKDELWYYSDQGYITLKNGVVTSIASDEDGY